MNNQFQITICYWNSGRNRNYSLIFIIKAQDGKAAIRASVREMEEVWEIDL